MLLSLHHVISTWTINLDYQREEHRVHLILYHLVWRPKRRKPVLVGPVAARCRGSIEGICAERGWEIVALAIQPDHILWTRSYFAATAGNVSQETSQRYSDAQTGK
jgi:putative transposase